MVGHDEHKQPQRVSFANQVPDFCIKNTFIDFAHANENAQGTSLGAMSCPLSHFARVISPMLSPTTPMSEAESDSIRAMLMEISTPTGSQSLDLLSFLSRDLLEGPCKVSDVKGISTPTGSESPSWLSAFGRFLQEEEEPCKVPKFSQADPDFGLRVKNTFLELDHEEGSAIEEGSGLKTCPPLQFYSMCAPSSRPEEPMKVELPAEFLDADTLMASIGSALHWKEGGCEPCAWFWKPGGCRNGQSCTRCHRCPPGAVQERKKAKREARTRIVGSAGLSPPPPVPPSPPPNAGTVVDHGVPSQAIQAEHPMQDDAGKSQLHNPPAVLPSEGSALHEAGKCEPCSWFWKPQGCRWGQNCVRCHLCPEGAVKARKKKKMTAARGDIDCP
jgi:hypothetical protein